MSLYKKLLAFSKQFKVKMNVRGQRPESPVNFCAVFQRYLVVLSSSLDSAYFNGFLSK